MTKKLLTIFVFLLLATGVWSRHIVGGSLGYNYISNKLYQVQLTLYRDCSAGSLGPAAFLAISGSDTLSQANFQLISTRDVTGLGAACGDSSKCSGGSSPFGVLEEIYIDTLDLSSYSNCEWSLSWTQCCRSSDITTGGTGQPFCIKAYLNACLANSSPKFINDPQFFLCRNVDVSWSNAVCDLIDQQDSFSYELVSANQSIDTSINYSGNFAPWCPVGFFGFPYYNMSLPAGFQLRSDAGTTAFRPTHSNQVAPIAVKINEWRRINGQMQVVGTVARDIQIQIIDCNSWNRLSINAHDISVCLGDTARYLVRSDWSDLGDLNDSTFLQLMCNKYDAQLTPNNGKARMASGLFEWIPQPEHVGIIPHQFMFQVKDNNCPVTQTTYRHIRIRVKDTLPQPRFSAGVDQLIPSGKDSIQLQGIDSNSSLGSVFWSTTGSGSFSSYTAPNAWYRLSKDDKKTCELNFYRHAASSSYCVQARYDHSLIRQQFDTFHVGPGSIIPIGDSIVLNPLVVDSSETYFWTSNRGAFDDYLELNATYYPDSAERGKCSVMLYLNRHIHGNCAQVIDSVEYQWRHKLESEVIGNEDQFDRILIAVHTDFADSIHWWSQSGKSGVIPASNTLVYNTNANEKANGFAVVYFSQPSNCVIDGDTLNAQFQINSLLPAQLVLVYVYPNPANDILNVKTAGEIQSIQVIDIQGRVLVQSLVRALDIAHLASGSYILRVELKDGSVGVVRWQKQ